MAKPFKYDIGVMIELIRNKPCVWDKTLDCFRDRNEKLKVWDEICAGLDTDFYKMSRKEQRRLSELVTGKWQNIRDAFVKSLKKQSAHPTVRKYIYHDKLQFLMKVLHRDDYESKTYLYNSPEEEQTQRSEDSEVGRDDCSPQKKPRLQEDVDQEILKALRTTKAAPDEDEAFFMSITPSVRRMSEEGKLEFRMGVLGLIKNINSRAKDIPDTGFFSGNSSSNSHPSASFVQFPNSKEDDYIEDTHLFKCE